MLLAVLLPASAIESSASAETDGRRSGTEDMSPALRAMQADPLQNPGMLSVEEGAQRWREPMVSGRSCADCHGADGSAMKGVAARYPAFDERLGRPVSLGEWIMRHRQGLLRADRRQPDGDEGGTRAAADGLPPGPEDPLRLALESFVSHQSAGVSILAPTDPRLAPFLARGQSWWQQRMGQLDLSCAHCHDQRAGLRLAGALIPQGHPTGYPVDRLEWQGLGSLQRRFRNCLTGVRAEPFGPDSIEAVELELYLRQRAASLPIETPAVRP